MKIFRSHLILWAVILLGVHCGRQENQELITDSTASTIVPNPLTGTWKLSNNNIWYSSTLTLLEDGRFDYESMSCLGQTYSKGNWERKNSIIILTSFDSLKQKPMEPVFIEEEPTAVSNKDKKGSYWLNTEVKHITFNSFADAPVYFDNLQLQLINDTLYCLDLNSLLADSKYYKPKVY